jgi:hypothetical protein
VSYRWCPSGTCPPSGIDVGINTLSLVMYTTNFNGAASGDHGSSFLDEVVKKATSGAPRKVREFVIAGKTCKFYFGRLEMRDWSGVDKDVSHARLVEETFKDPATPDDAAPQTRPAKDTGNQIVAITGAFPGKEGEVMLNLHMAADQYNEEKVLAMLQSIR